MKQKRKPGAGRKPAGPFVQNATQLTVRMPTNMRAELEAAAEKRGWSLTQELLWRVQNSFNREHDKRRDPALRALNFVIAQIAERVSGGMFTRDEEYRQESLKKWRTAPFEFKAFKLAVRKLLDELQPPGDVQPVHSEEALKEATKHFTENVGFSGELVTLAMEAAKTPEAFADFVFRDLWTRLTTSTPLTERERLIGRLVPQFGKMIEREFYGFDDARRDLRLPGFQGKKP